MTASVTIDAVEGVFAPHGLYLPWRVQAGARHARYRTRNGHLER